MTPTLEHRYTAVQIDGSERVQTFTYTGSDQRYTVPDGTAQLHVRMWGAGGGGAGRSPGGSGGSGGYTESTITLPSGTTTLTVMVGRGGTKGENLFDSYGGGGGSGEDGTSSGGQGGGRSCIRLNDEDILTAGGGGGGERSRGAHHGLPAGAGERDGARGRDWQDPGALLQAHVPRRAQLHQDVAAED